MTVAKIKQSLPEQKRDGDVLAWSMSRSITHSAELSTNLASGILTQSQFIPLISEQLKEDPAQVVKDLIELRDVLVAPGGIRVAVAGDVLGLSAPRSAWLKNFQAVQVSRTLHACQPRAVTDLVCHSHPQLCPCHGQSRCFPSLDRALRGRA